MGVKKVVSKIHLWLGFLSGVVVLISMSAAALYTWEQDLQYWYYQDWIFVEISGTEEVLPLERLWQNAQESVPGKKILGVEINSDPKRSYAFYNYQGADLNQARIFWWDDYAHYEYIYVNPYSGEVLGIKDLKKDWIYNTRMLHQYFLLTYEVGHLIVGVSTLLVLILTVTGLFLWFPRKLKNLKQRLTFKWSARWRRLNFDIHQVGGFYLHGLIFILAVTGLVWTFDWWTNGIYRLLGNDPEKVWKKHQPLILEDFPEVPNLETILQDLKIRRDNWKNLSIYLPEDPSENSEIGTYLAFDGDSGWDEWDSYYYHPISAQVLATELQEDKTLGAKWRNSNYAIHVGSIYGLPTKIMATSAALFLSSLPVTGFLIWFGRKKNKKITSSFSESDPIKTKK
jgi:uncharacterized iron-regulated membrane protein